MVFLFVSLLVFLFICLSLLLFVCFRTRQKFKYLRLKMQEKTKKLLKFQRVQKVAKIFNMLYAYFTGVCWCCGPVASMPQNNVAIHNKFEKYTQLQNTTPYQSIFPLTPKNTLFSLLSQPVSMTFCLVLTLSKNLPGQFKGPTHWDKSTLRS